MATRGRPTAAVELSKHERETLLRWSRRAKSAQALALRCRIVLACADGMSNVEVAATAAGGPRHGGQVAVAGSWPSAWTG